MRTCEEQNQQPLHSCFVYFWGKVWCDRVCSTLCGFSIKANSYYSDCCCCCFCVSLSNIDLPFVPLTLQYLFRDPSKNGLFIYFTFIILIFILTIFRTTGKYSTKQFHKNSCIHRFYWQMSIKRIKSAKEKNLIIMNLYECCKCRNCLLRGKCISS